MWDTVHSFYFGTLEVRFIFSLTFWKLSLAFDLEYLSQFCINFNNQWQFQNFKAIFQLTSCFLQIKHKVIQSVSLCLLFETNHVYANKIDRFCNCSHCTASYGWVKFSSETCNISEQHSPPCCLAVCTIPCYFPQPVWILPWLPGLERCSLSRPECVRLPLNSWCPF